MNAFLTGSQAYGTPRPDSDIDLAVLLNAETLTMLGKLSGQFRGDTSRCPYHSGMSLRFGNLNLLCFDDKVEFQAWKDATTRLIARMPVTREQAVQEIDLEIAAAKQRETA